MTKEEKQLLLVDLCGRLPYGVICDIYNDTCTIKEKLSFGGITNFADGKICVKPYLRPMSSMTEEEKKEYWQIRCPQYDENNNIIITDAKIVDWLNAHHFDYRNLIEKGLALEAPEGMYN
ncbi:MAG: hypothetical protein IJ669_01300 [Prevotella sp.]|nr:hypothetical protein [Prevotella sp.]